ncbi:MAG TPA: TolC family protein [Anaeromyxobacter sp.]|nr:TolC family protein [Anaeromyxobacter sp.]
MSLRELLAVALVAAVGAARAGEPLTPADAVARALAQNADVRAAEVDVRAAKARLEGAAVLLASNPEISGAVGPRDAPEGRTIDYEVAVSQRVEIAGQRGSRTAAARAALGAAEARLASTRARVAAEVRDLLGRAAAARLRVEVADEARRLAEEAAKGAERRFGAGDAARIEVNSARVELGRATRAALEAEQERLAAVGELELVIGAAPGAVQAVAFALEREGGAAEPPVEALVREALTSRRDVAAARLDVESASAESSLATRSVVPTPSLGVSVAREDGADIVLGTLSFELPLFARSRGERGAAAARAQQARVALEALERRAAQEVRLAAERVRAARRMVAAFDAPTMAALGENLALVTRAYEAGQIDFVRYQLIRREALDARRDRVDALEALNRAEAQLERALGREPGSARAG